MRYHALACDYDGTLARHGKVDSDTLAALRRFTASGRRLLLVTGRELDELLGILPEIDLFEWVVAENGGLLFRPADRQIWLLAEAPPEKFPALLRDRGVASVAVGRTIVATWRPYETVVFEAIRDLGLELQVIFNKNAVMVLPSGVNKASGLRAALKELKFSPHEVVGVGDAENDHAFLSLCGFSVAVANALPSLKEHADLVTARDHGGGVQELIDELLRDEFATRQRTLDRQQLLLGVDVRGVAVSIGAHGPGGLVVASPDAERTALNAFLESLVVKKYQFCVLDSAGYYAGLKNAVAPGAGTTPPAVDEILQVLAQPDQNVVVNLKGQNEAERSLFLRGLLSAIQDMRSRTGRPHWLIADLAEHLLPAQPDEGWLPWELERMILVTADPERVQSTARKQITTVLHLGPDTTA